MAEKRKNTKKVPNLRFPKFEGEWKEELLGELGDFSGGGTPSSSNTSFWSGTIPWISSSDLNENDIHSINITRFITEEAISNSSTKLCTAPVILIVSRVGVGKLAYSEERLCTSQDFTNITNLRCDGLFLSYLLSTTMRKASSSTQGTSIKGIASSEIKSKKIFIPKLVEQKKIAEFISLIDDRIRTQNKIIKDLELLKNTICKKIFSRQVRLKSRNNEVFSDWKLKKLGDLCEIIGGGTPETNKSEYWNGEVQWFTPTEIKRNFVSKSERTITLLGLKNSSAKVLPKGAILLTTRATIGEVAIALEECTTNQGFQSLVAKKNCNNVFIFNWIKSNKNAFVKRASGSTFPEISKSEIEKIEIEMPCLSEQALIADLFSLLDKKIEFEKRIIKLHDKEKKYILTNLFI